jgi:glycosyltransferase involved in cell wall biosynthesis
MKRHMELHALGLERLGHRAELVTAEDFEEGLGRRFPRQLPGLRAYFSVHERLARDRPDIVNIHTGIAPAFIAAKRLGLHDARVVVMSYSADEPQVEIRGPIDLARRARIALPARWSFPRADGIWCVNSSDVAYYVSEYGVDRARVARFPHTVADSFFEAREARRDPLQILYAGTWIQRKGVDVLSGALDGVVRALPDVRIVLAGTLTGEETVRKALAPNVAARTKILDRASDEELAELYRTSTLLVLPSRREGLPFVMLEAMACGCPPLAAANSGMLDVVVNGENGWLETSFDPERWGARIVELLGRPRELEAASSGAARMAREFRVEPVAASVVRWYESLGRAVSA